MRLGQGLDLLWVRGQVLPCKYHIHIWKPSWKHWKTSYWHSELSVSVVLCSDKKKGFAAWHPVFCRFVHAIVLKDVNRADGHSVRDMDNAHRLCLHVHHSFRMYVNTEEWSNLSLHSLKCFSFRHKPTHFFWFYSIYIKMWFFNVCYYYLLILTWSTVCTVQRNSLWCCFTTSLHVNLLWRETQQDWTPTWELKKNLPLSPLMHFLYTTAQQPTQWCHHSSDSKQTFGFGAQRKEQTTSRCRQSCTPEAVCCFGVVSILQKIYQQWFNSWFKKTKWQNAELLLGLAPVLVPDGNV